MQKIIKQAKGDLVQITIADERWYVKSDDEGNEKFVPSVTWIAGHYPKGVAFYKWLANHGWDEAEAIKNAAADKGSKIHKAIDDLLDGNEIEMDAKYLDADRTEGQELSLEEWEALMSFAEWHKAVKPKLIAKENAIFSDKYGYAGTIDMVCEIDGKPWIIDFKTGQYIWPEYELQVSAYKQAWKENDGDDVNIGILQLGYRLNKKKYKFTELKDKFPLFLSARTIWANEQEGVEPKKKDYPLKIKL